MSKYCNYYKMVLSECVNVFILSWKVTNSRCFQTSHSRWDNKVLCYMLENIYYN